jgi:hypothetical protein
MLHANGGVACFGTFHDEGYARNEWGLYITCAVWLNEGSPRYMLIVLGVIAIKTSVAWVVSPNVNMIMELLQLSVGP